MISTRYSIDIRHEEHESNPIKCPEAKLNPENGANYEINHNP
jgi:hypothetical protein